MDGGLGVRRSQRGFFDIPRGCRARWLALTYWVGSQPSVMVAQLAERRRFGRASKVGGSRPSRDF